MDYMIVTVSVPRELCQKMIEGIGTTCEAWDAYELLKSQVRKDEANMTHLRRVSRVNRDAVSHPFDTELECPSLDQSMVDADASNPYGSCMGIFEGYEEYDQDALISADEYNHRGPGC